MNKKESFKSYHYDIFAFTYLFLEALKKKPFSIDFNNQIIKGHIEKSVNDDIKLVKAIYTRYLGYGDVLDSKRASLNRVLERNYEYIKEFIDKTLGQEEDEIGELDF